jgi:hypothetical protein
MEMQELEIFIDPEGEVSVRVKGLKGKGCLELTKPLEEQLGSEIKSRSYTSEYYEDTKDRPTLKEK